MMRDCVWVVVNDNNCVTDHYVFADGCEEQTEVRTVEEESLFSLAFPGIVQDFHRERAEAQENKMKSTCFHSKLIKLCRWSVPVGRAEAVKVKRSSCASGSESRWALGVFPVLKDGIKEFELRSVSHPRRRIPTAHTHTDALITARCRTEVAVSFTLISHFIILTQNYWEHSCLTSYQWTLEMSSGK